MRNHVPWMIALAAVAAGCLEQAKENPMEKQPLTYKVHKLSAPIKVDGNWDKPQWKEIEPILISKHMGKTPEHRPKVEAKLAYDDQAIYVIYRVEDQYVRAVAQNYQDSVCRDSCAEFFFTPGMNLGLTYFNVEINCGGTMLLHYHPADGKTVPVESSDCDTVQIAHSLPKIVDPEITAPTTWTLEYRMPFDLIQKYCPAATKPAPGAAWRANLYKCADATSHPHWLTWSYVDFPKPKFHMPEFFGSLLFE